jgi:1-acyl-sn-glycerol-3-phosphate acyltransferase
MTSSLWWVLLALFATPLLRILRPLWSLGSLERSGLNALLGSLERHSSRYRELLVVIGTAVIFWKHGRAAQLYGLSCAFLLLLAKQQRFYSERRCAEMMRANARILPHDFFHVSDLEFGPAGSPRDWKFSSQASGEYKFRRERETPSFWSTVKIFLASAWLTRLIIQSEAWLGPKYYKLLFEQASRLWSLVVLSISGSNMRTEGMELLEQLPLGGRRLFLFNHVSMTDFAFGFAALDHFIDAERAIRLRFVIAKDHFIDNPLIYSVGGIGRCIELAGMIPIDRKNSKNAVVALEGAAKLIAKSDIDLAIYPQGTRALAQLDLDGSCRRAGFYSSARPEKAREELGHMKKGTAFMTHDVLRALRETETPVHLVIVGIHGAGALMRKGSLTIQRGQDMLYKVSEVLTLMPSELRTLDKYDDAGEILEESKVEAEELTRRIERALAKACGIDQFLKDQFKEECGREMPESAALLRLFDHVLVVDPKRREPLIERLKALPPDKVSDEELAPLFEEMLQLRQKP